MLNQLKRRFMERRAGEPEGFTLIELLIVVVIIGILAAIAIPQFTSTKQSAYQATVKSDLKNSMTALESYYAQQNNYPTSQTEASDELQLSDKVSVNTYDYSSSTSSYCLALDHTNLDNTWSIANASSSSPSGASNYTPGTPYEGGC